MAVTNKKIIHLNLPFEGSFLAAQYAISEMKAKPLQVGQNSGVIVAHMGFNFRSNGEIVTIAIRPSQNSAGCDVYLESTSKTWTTLVDWGKNQDNLDQMERLLLKAENEVIRSFLVQNEG